MQMSQLISSLALLSSTAVTGCLALQYQAFGSDQCTDRPGRVHQVNEGICHNARNRHSFRVTGGPARVTIYSASRCNSPDFSMLVENGKCYNVNTGGDWGSIRVTNV